MTTKPLKPCPCGATPKALGYIRVHDQSMWAMAFCPECDWMIEFRAGHASTTSKKFIRAAAKAWNAAPRGGMKGPQ